MTSRSLPILLLSLIASLPGCGGPSISKPGPTSPHGGLLVELPDGGGFAEVLKQPAPGKPGLAVVVVYFLDRDRNPMASPPTAATIKGPTTGGRLIPFKPIEGTDASKVGGLASESITDRGEIEVELTATIGGSPVTIPILLR